MLTQMLAQHECQWISMAVMVGQCISAASRSLCRTSMHFKMSLKSLWGNFVWEHDIAETIGKLTNT